MSSPIPESLLSSVEVVSSILDRLPQGLVVYRLERPGDPASLRVLFLNEAAVRLLSIDDTATLVGATVPEIDPTWEKNDSYRTIAAVVEEGEAADLGYIDHVREDGERSILSARAFPLSEDRVGVSFEDVTGDIEVRQRLENHALRFQAIFDATFQLIGLLEPDGTLIEANRTALEFGGLEPEEVIGLPFWETYWWGHDPELQALVKDAVRRAAEGEFIRFNAQVRGAFDTRAVIDFSLKPVYRNNQVALLIPEGRVITDLMKAQQAIKELQKRTERILNAAGEGVVGIDADGIVTFVNEAAAALLGPPQRVLVGRPHDQVLRSGDGDAAGLPVERVLRHERSRRAGMAYLRRDDSESFPVEFIVTPLREEGRTGAVVVFRDISERLEAEQALRESEIRYRTVVESLNEGVVLQGSDGRILAANAAAEEILGLRVEGMLGRTSDDPRWQVVDEHEQPLPGDRHPAMVSLRTGRQVDNFVQGLRTPDGEERWLLVNSSPIVGSDGSSHAVVSTFTDITRQRKNEKLLKESEVRYRTVLATLDEGVLLVAEDGTIITSNPAAEAILGIDVSSENNMSALGANGLVNEDGEAVPEEKRPDRVAVTTGEPQRGTVLGVRDAGGHFRWVSINAQPIPSLTEGAGRSVVVSVDDITEQLEAERELRASEKRLRNAQQIARLGNWRWDPHTDRITWSDQMYRIYGQDRETFEPTLEHFLEVIEPEHRDSTREAIEHALKTGEPYEVIHQIRLPDGRTRYVHGRGEAVSGASGEVRYLQGTSQDITDQQQAREALQHYARELEERNTELEQFAYVASHDLQEPLRMVSSFLQLLERRYSAQLDEAAHEYIHYAVDGAKRMQRLIQDLLAYSRVGTRGRSFEQVDVHRALTDVLTDLAPAIDESEAEVIVEEQMPVLEADPTQVRQLFQNLIGNAIKFRGSDPPRIQIRASRVRENRRPAWRFEVEDNGIGIAPEHADRIFQIFQRLHTRDEYAGTGIGLAVCRKIVDRHGGQIRVESEPGRGSTFIFTLPVRPDRHNDAPPTV